MEKFSERLKTLRLLNNLTLVQLANDTNISKSSLSSWENGEKIPIATAIIVLAQYFNVTTERKSQLPLQ